MRIKYYTCPSARTNSELQENKNVANARAELTLFIIVFSNDRTYSYLFYHIEWQVWENKGQEIKNKLKCSTEPHQNALNMEFVGPGLALLKDNIK